MARGETALKEHTASSGRLNPGSRRLRSGSAGGKQGGTSGRKKSAARKAASKPAKRGTKKSTARRKKSAPVRNPIRDDVSIIIVFAVSVLLFLGCLGLGGRVGNGLGNIFFGLMGVMAWIFPFALFFSVAFTVANRGNPKLVRKIIGGILLFVFIAAFAQLLSDGYMRGMHVTDCYIISSEDHSGGGFLGGIIVYLFGTAFGEIGAFILSAAGIIISLILLTQQPLITAIGKHSRKAAVRRKARREALRAADRRAYERRMRDEERIREDAENKALKDAGRSGKNKDRGKADSGRSSDTARTAAFSEEFIAAVRAEAARGENIKDTAAPGHKEDTVGKTQRTGKDHAGSTVRGGRTAAGTPLQGGAASAKEQPERFGSPARSAVKTAGDAFPIPEFLKKNEKAPEKAGSAEGEAAKKRLAAAKAAGNAQISISGMRDGGAVVPEVSQEEGTAHGRTASSAAGESVGPRQNAEKEKRETSAEREMGIRQVESQIGKTPSAEYVKPPVRLLTPGKHFRAESEQNIMATAEKLQKTLMNFGVNVKVTGVSCGPTVTRYELQPDQGVKVSRIVNLQDDIKLNLAAAEIRIEAPIPGKAAVGIEVPNKDFQPVMLREIIDTKEFQESRARLAFAVGKDLSGRPVIADIEKMPHLLIAGATGSGKSVCINTLIMSLIYKYSPAEVRLLMIDPKVVELKIYDGIPHLLIPVVTDAKKAASALNWAVGEMTKRYQLFASYTGVRDIKSYNAMAERMSHGGDGTEKIDKLPRIVVIVDELADLMMVASQDVEDAICRLAQLARAAGIHLVIATQRPSVNVVTGQIKANMPSRIALAVSSGVDSRTIIDMNGAEKLLGKGDMLYYPQGYPKPARVQGAFVSDQDISRVVDFLTAQKTDEVYNEKEKSDQAKIVASIESGVNGMTNGAVSSDSGRDEYFTDAGRLIIEKDKASIGMLQRAFKIGFNRAARIMDQLCDAGVVGGEEGTKPRKILMTAEEFEQFAAGKKAE